MSIPAEAYLGPEWLERELDAWFADRVFVDLACGLPEIDAWRAFQLGRRQLLVRRSDADWHAHDNVCLHRSAQLAGEGRGHGDIRCGYHGWRYDAEGYLVQTPLLDAPCLSRRQIRSYPACEREGLVWMSPSGQLPVCEDDPALLRDFPVAAARPFHHDVLMHQANWKLLVENVIEGYHLSFVHAGSFVPAGFPSTAPVSQGCSDSGSWAHTTPRQEPGRPAPRGLPGAVPGYRHAYLFPNLFLSVTNGLVLFVSRFHPVSATQTRLEYDLLATPLLLSQRPAVIAHVQAEAIAFTDRVLREDLALLEGSQRGLASSGQPHQLQALEPRITHFHEAYLRRMAC